MVKTINRFEIRWVNLDPTLGSEVKKTRPGLVISDNVSNRWLHTVIIVPMTHTLKGYPTRISIHFDTTDCELMTDQLRCVDKKRLISKIGVLEEADCEQVCDRLQEMFSYG